MAAYKPYPKYKHSGVPWLGEVPEHWEVIKLIGVCSFIRGNSSFKKDELLSSGKYIALQYGKTYKINEVDERYQFYVNDEFYKDSQIVNHGDVIIISTSETIEDLGHSVFYNRHDLGLLGGEQVLLRPKNNKISGKYLYYSTKTFTNELKMHATGIKVFRFNITDLKSIYTFTPPPTEQTTIARFLDYKLAKINRFIRKKKQLIKLLNEQKAAIINQAVTKGLDPNARMKDSGVEWLGEIPAHWEVRKLKYVADVVLGKMLCNEDKGGYFKKPYLKSKNIQWLKVDISDVEEMWFSEPELEFYRLKKGDLILSEGGEVGKTCIWNDELDECYIQNSAHKVSIREEYLNTYFLYLFNAYGKKGGFDSIVNKVSIAHLTKDKLVNVKCVVPPISEQHAIVSHIESETAILTTTISKIEKEIALVEEYKTALIAEAVTGKIDVRGYEVPELENEEEGYEEMEEEMSITAEDDAADYQTEETV